MPVQRYFRAALVPGQAIVMAATLVDGPVALTLLFRIDDAGLIESFRAAARDSMVGEAMVQAPWEGRFSNHQARDGMLVPRPMKR